jgi:Fe2+ or Zn2+ uptake regulation protein
MHNSDQAAQDLRCILLSELTDARTPLTTAQLRHRINQCRGTEVVLEAIYRNLCILRDRGQIHHAGRNGRHTLWTAGPAP